jgi:hypothetical protein
MHNKTPNVAILNITKFINIPNIPEYPYDIGYCTVFSKKTYASCEWASDKAHNLK